LLFIEGYDLHIARRLVSGVDVWLNNPVHPLEASGTSGMKAGMNGVINLSILDGWWGEGYDGQNGWAIKPASPQLDQHRRDREEARTLYELLQDSVLPLYYKRAAGGYSAGWIRMAKRSTASPPRTAAKAASSAIASISGPAWQGGSTTASASTRVTSSSPIRSRWDSAPGFSEQRARRARRAEMPAMTSRRSKRIF